MHSTVKLMGYSFYSKAYRVYNKNTRIIKENIHVTSNKNYNGHIRSFSFQELQLNTNTDDNED